SRVVYLRWQRMHRQAMIVSSRPSGSARCSTPRHCAPARPWTAHGASPSGLSTASPMPHPLVAVLVLVVDAPALQLPPAPHLPHARPPGVRLGVGGAVQVGGRTPEPVLPRLADVEHVPRRPHLAPGRPQR